MERLDCPHCGALSSVKKRKYVLECVKCGGKIRKGKGKRFTLEMAEVLLSGKSLKGTPYGV